MQTLDRAAGSFSPRGARIEGGEAVPELKLIRQLYSRVSDRYCEPKRQEFEGMNMAPRAVDNCQLDKS